MSVCGRESGKGIRVASVCGVVLNFKPKSNFKSKNFRIFKTEKLIFFKNFNLIFLKISLRSKKVFNVWSWCE